MTTFTTQRHIALPPALVFAAIEDPARLARWWGPKGFSNRFSVFEFRPGGRWVFTMHGPDAAVYPNESTFVAIRHGAEVVIRHTCEPFFQLTIGLAAAGGGTLVRWEQVFDDAQVAAAVRHIVVPANEQNLDRLTAEVLAGRVIGA